MLKPYKFIIHAVCQQTDDNNNVTGELTTEQVVVFGCDQLADWAAAFPAHLAAAELTQAAP